MWVALESQSISQCKFPNKSFVFLPVVGVFRQEAVHEQKSLRSWTVSNSGSAVSATWVDFFWGGVGRGGFMLLKKKILYSLSSRMCLCLDVDHIELVLDSLNHRLESNVGLWFCSCCTSHHKDLMNSERSCISVRFTQTAVICQFPVTDLISLSLETAL